VEELVAQLGREVQEVGGRATTREETAVAGELRGGLERMAALTAAFQASREGAGTRLLVDNIRHVLKSEEDVYNYFIKFGQIELITDLLGSELGEEVHQGIRVQFERAEAVERALRFPHEVVTVQGDAAGGHRGGGEDREGKHMLEDRRDSPSSEHCDRTQAGGSEPGRSRDPRRCREGETSRGTKRMAEEEGSTRRRMASGPARTHQDWSRDFAEIGRQEEARRKEEREAALDVQGRLLRLVNREPTPREEEVVILPDPGMEASRRFKEEARALDLLEHAKEKAEYAAILKQFNIVEVPRPQHAIIELLDSDDD
jgi:hypothetical protein